MNEKPCETEREQACPQRWTGEQRKPGKDAESDNSFVIPHCPCEQNERHREHRPVCLARKRDEAGIVGEEEGKDQRRAGVDLLTEEIWNKNQHASRERRQKARQKVRAFGDRK